MSTPTELRRAILEPLGYTVGADAYGYIVKFNEEPLYVFAIANRWRSVNPSQVKAFQDRHEREGWAKAQRDHDNKVKGDPPRYPIE